jgi:hypothetical protein
VSEYLDEIARFAHPLNDYAFEIVKAQTKAANGHLDGIFILGDVAYKKGMMFSLASLRSQFKPGVEALIDECLAHGIPVIYRGCGNVNRIFEDYIEIGVDAYNPLEFKAGMDTVASPRKFDYRIGFCGNMNMWLLDAGSREKLKAAKLTKLNAAKDGGFIFQSDRNVQGDVPPANYDSVVKLV